MLAYEMEVTYKPLVSIANLHPISSTKESAEYLRTIWNQYLCSKESFYVLLLNVRGCVMGHSLISIGNKVSTVVDVAEVCKYAILSNATSVIISHNHPSNNLNPSQPDQILTKRIVKALELFNIALLDHIIMAPEGYYSFADHSQL